MPFYTMGDFEDSNNIRGKERMAYRPEGSNNVRNRNDSDIYQSMMGYGEQVHDIPMGDLWSDLQNQATKLWDAALTSGQKAVTKAVEKEIYKLVGIDGKEYTVEKGSAQEQALLAQGATGAGFMDRYGKEVLIGGAVLGGLLVTAIFIKALK